MGRQEVGLQSSISLSERLFGSVVGFVNDVGFGDDVVLRCDVAGGDLPVSVGAEDAGGSGARDDRSDGTDAGYEGCAGTAHGVVIAFAGEDSKQEYGPMRKNSPTM